jgi:Spy/CpxP family protein refolding chaperone
MSEQEQTPALPPAPRRRWVKALLVVTVFLCGMVCGAGITAVGVGHLLRDVVRHPEKRAERAAGHLARRLDLTPEQRREVGDILARQAADLQSLRGEVWPRVLQRLERSEAEIASVLTPEQKEQWKLLAARLREEWLPPPPPPETAK